ncbi:MAG: rhodanese-like domain-containing protein [Actinomycetota bacterium]
MGAAHPEYLVEPEWLADRLDDPTVRVLDVTAQLDRELVNHAKAACFDAAHLPGSVFFDVSSARGALSDPHAELPWTWPRSSWVDERLAEAGVADDTTVVLVARTPREGIDSGTMWCTRAWWTLHHMGVDCRILRGGLERWEAEGRPLTDEPTAVSPGSVRTSEAAAGACASKEDVLAALESGRSCVLDALPASSFDGTDGGYGPRRGHITGAVNLPFRGLVERETAAFPDADVLRERVDALGLLDHERVVTYCGGAIAATVPAFVLAMLGHDDVGVYDGSLMEWAADESLPMTDPS